MIQYCSPSNIDVAQALSCGEEQDNFAWPIEVPLTGKICLPKSRCSVETVRKCQLVYYAYNYKKVDEQGFKVVEVEFEDKGRTSKSVGNINWNKWGYASHFLQRLGN
ncbi:hypothetical protein R3W88_019191 [Solanum pinnatisectum]|uniref:Uncharacterized protein n=1 Tax=Solanum pinnatisectum TaxID=50273 RepID=A0AAV9KL66_9SOLN|nr:hypothetical protein R3W88_019191 [Solanum pinnatisectum]